MTTPETTLDDNELQLNIEIARAVHFLGGGANERIVHKKCGAIDNAAAIFLTRRIPNPTYMRGTTYQKTRTKIRPYSKKAKIEMNIDYTC